MWVKEKKLWSKHYFHFEKVCVWGWICLSLNALDLSVFHLELCIKSRCLAQALRLQRWKLINIIWGYIRPVEELPDPLSRCPSERPYMKISVTCRRVIWGEILVLKGSWLKKKESHQLLQPSVLFVRTRNMCDHLLFSVSTFTKAIYRKDLLINPHMITIK